MKLALRWFSHPSWELPKQPGFKAIKHTPIAWVEQAAQVFVKRLMADAEPRVWYTCDADGNLWWHAHDSVTDRSFHHASEAEMRVWLEQRHDPSGAN